MDSLHEHSWNMAKVDPYGCWDGAVDGVAGDEEFESMLDGIMDFPDFPMEHLDVDGFAGEWDASKSQYLGPIPMDILLGPPTIAQHRIDEEPSVFKHRPVALNDTTTETQQLTYKFEDVADSCIRQQNKFTKVHETGSFQSQSPVSVLENSGSSLAGKSLLLKSHIAKRPRSKRARPTGVSPWLLMSPLFSTFYASRKTCDAKKMKERRNKLPHPSVTKQTIENFSGTTRNSYQVSDYAELGHASSQLRPTKKCTHCEITKTPQWREGPKGPKTLCNACGVRYRSGRLFPEYRPAASPTFVPSLHSNSHKKVVEMRNKGKHQVINTTEQPSMSPQLEIIPVSSYLFDPIF